MRHLVSGRKLNRTASHRRAMFSNMAVSILDKERVGSLLSIMGERERKVLDMRFGLEQEKPHTLAEVAKELGVSRERVRQIEEAALKKLRKFAEQNEKGISK